MSATDICGTCGAPTSSHRDGCQGPKPRPARFPLLPTLVAAVTVIAMAAVAAPIGWRLLVHADDRPAAVVSMPGGAASLTGATPVTVGNRHGVACLIGTWKETFHEETVPVPATGPVRFTGAGSVVSFRADGAGSEEYVDVHYTADKLALNVTGVTTYRYQAGPETIAYQALSVAGGVTVSVSGTDIGSQPFLRDQRNGTNQYTCTGNRLTITAGGGFRQELTRVG
jgi:hypothetical protein